MRPRRSFRLRVHRDAVTNDLMATSLAGARKLKGQSVTTHSYLAVGAHLSMPGSLSRECERPVLRAAVPGLQPHSFR